MAFPGGLVFHGFMSAERSGFGKGFPGDAACQSRPAGESGRFGAAFGRPSFQKTSASYTNHAQGGVYPVMKRKLLVAGAVLVALFVGMVLVVGLMKSSPSARREFYQVSATADGQLVLEPTARNTFVVMSKASVTNLPGRADSNAR